MILTMIDKSKITINRIRDLLDYLETKTDKTDFDDIVAEIKQKILEEELRAKGVESNLDKKIDDETNRASLAESILDAKIGDLSISESYLTDKINEEI